MGESEGEAQWLRENLEGDGGGGAGETVVGAVRRFEGEQFCLAEVGESLEEGLGGL